MGQIECRDTTEMSFLIKLVYCMEMMKTPRYHLLLPLSL